MNDMAKFPYLTKRKGSQNFYYKREVPPELRGEGRASQVWSSLGTPDLANAKAAYIKTHTLIEARFDEWRGENNQLPNTAPLTTIGAAPLVPLTPGLLRRLSDAHYLEVQETDFHWRGELWRRVNADEEAFWRGEIIPHPIDDWQSRRGREHSYYAMLMEEPVLEEVFLYCVSYARRMKLRRLHQLNRLGDSSEREAAADDVMRAKGVRLCDTDRMRLVRRLLEAEINALEDLVAGDEKSSNQVLDRAATADLKAEVIPSQPPPAPGESMSLLIEKYLDELARERNWPRKTVLRKQGELREFLEIVGDKPVNGYSPTDGVKFKDVQMNLPANRQVPPFKGLGLEAQAKLAAELGDGADTIELLSPLTINDKINTVSLFFEWAAKRFIAVVNPVTGLQMRRAKSRRNGKKRHPWTIGELNKMFTAPVYSGCRSERHWQEPGDLVMWRSAKFWVPLIALFSGMRLGEIIQMQVADVKTLEGITYFDVTPLASVEEADEELADDEDKSLKTASSRRGIPVHATLFDIGFGDFLEFRRQSGALRLFPEYEKAKDDGSWSKQFSKHFHRFRQSIGVNRRGVKFHSLRHNVEDALRNANVRKEVRDAIQGHSESGVSREYGSGYYVTTLNEDVQKIRYDGLDLSHLCAK